MADLAAPLRVSPFIRFSRWSLLLAGIAYGAIRHGSLSRKEAAIREVETKQKAIRDAKLAEEKKRLAKLELDDLAKMAGVPPEP
ncbi:hypothetical protein L9F63_004763 [Diploptera punctata]|uniref:ATP synthase F(0) complex subunit e, mitochondrial n=1 Tax=Diploptera punctata TaxID=6984 RepID=A0AAD7ZGJ9_DIPPU|nr:hypothetical protein L9F63_004763 [Diploptera punctata]